MLLLFLAAGRREEVARVQLRIEELRRPPEAPVAPAGDQTQMSPADMLFVAGEQARQAGNTEAPIDAWLEEGRAHSRAGRPDAALDACLRALSLSSGAPRIHLALARLYFERGWHEQGIERALLLDQTADTGSGRHGQVRTPRPGRCQRRRRPAPYRNRRKLDGRPSRRGTVTRLE